MTDPVLMRDGRTYERAAIAAALEQSPVSPISRQPLLIDDAIPNRALKNLIDQFLAVEVAITARLPAEGRLPEIRFTAMRGDTIHAVKAKLAELAGVPVEDQTLKLREETLEDENTVLYSGICDGGCIDIACPLVQILIKANSSQTLVVRVFSFQKVIDLKRIVEEKTGMPPEVQTLGWQGKPLKDEERLSKYRITPDSTVYVTGRLLGGSD
jgi:hypothetical protein